jgi:snurportin-1
MQRIPASTALQANTALHSRVKGLAFLRFPAPLPPDTVLDCILDDDASETGVLHVLDVIRWRGTDVADCEADFRYVYHIFFYFYLQVNSSSSSFWFRDARLAELIPLPEPTRTVVGSRPYPHRFIGVPYFLPPLTPTLFLQSIIPAAQAQGPASADINEMDMDAGEGNAAVRKSDGILLYVKEATYTSGETPLSCWVPAAPLDNAMNQEPPLQAFQRYVSWNICFC